MPPESTVGVRSPSSGKGFHTDADEWLNDKRATDGAEGLWRIHDELYDLTNLIRMHPGGQFWIRETQGMDITEAFETHHISTIPEDLLENYYVREAVTPRASPFTFKENGFYKTLKNNARVVLKTIPRNNRSPSDIFTDALLIATFTFGVFACAFWSYLLGILSGLCFALTIVAAHNYSHRRDNFRMYYSDICFEESRLWRIIHVLSHHLFTNTIADMQAYLGEPLAILYPQKKPFVAKYLSWFYLPVFIWPTIYFFRTFAKASKIICFWQAKSLDMTDFLPFSFPIVMYCLGGQSILATLGMWQFILSVGSFIFSAVAFTGGHFHPDIFIDGDTARAESERDWGINQLDCVADRSEVTGNHFLVLVSFGDHALHHLFPTLDHGILKHLYPVAQETMKQFNLDMRMTTQMDMFKGYFRQIAKEKPNPNPPVSKT